VVAVDDAGHLLPVGEEVPTMCVPVNTLRWRGQRLDDRLPSGALNVETFFRT